MAFTRAEARLFQLVGAVDLQNRVRLDDAEEHEQAQRRKDVQRLLKENE
jgi:hypothetical protein